MRRIGILETSSGDPARLQLWELFRQRLLELGYVEGRDISFESRWAQGNADLLPKLAAELVALEVDAIVTAGTPAAFAAKRATTTIPIVMATGVSVDTGMNESSSGLPGNVTGLSDLAPGLSTRRLELLAQVVPGAAQLAVLWDQTNQAGSLVVGEYQDAARSLGSSLEVFGVRAPDDFDVALPAMARRGAGGFIGVTSAMFFGERERLAALALECRLPAMFVRREYAEAGALMAFGAPIRDNYRRAAGYVDKIFKGARPADLPVDQPTGFELVINRKTAQALGLTIPQAMLHDAQLVE
ncbi:MAG: ABC transporter substrate-binding protein [Betaproteobacteria bacterium]|nr:ABC transporter substrate-binding protein [Betaproteobacteria bacterium]